MSRSPRSTRSTAFLLALALPVFALSACSDDSAASDASGKDNGDRTTTTEAAAAGKGEGTFVVGDRTYTFQAEPCAVDATSVEASGKGSFDNRPFTVTVRHSESDSSAIETVQVVFTASEALVGTNFVPLPDGKDAVKLKATKDGKVEGTIPVSGTGGQPSGDGQLTLTCEA